MADVEVRDKVELLDPLVEKLRHSVTDPISKCALPFSLHLLMHLWLYDGPVTKDQDHISFHAK